MAKGAVAKEQIINQILNTFEGAFKYDKEVRIPMMENGEEVQIKLTLTCAKVNVERGGDTALPGASANKTVASKASGIGSASASSVSEPTEEEKKNVADLVAKLGL